MLTTAIAILALLLLATSALLAFHALSRNAILPAAVLRIKAGARASDSARPTHPTPTSFTFPTVEERVAYLMGSWHAANRTLSTDEERRIGAHWRCDEFQTLEGRSVASGTFRATEVLYPLSVLRRTERLNQDARSYFQDAANVLATVQPRSHAGTNAQQFVLAQFGDSFSTNTNLPTVSKARLIEGFGEQKYRPIIWPLTVRRHLEEPLKKYSGARDIPWEQKKAVLVWRGGCSGMNINKLRRETPRRDFVRRYSQSPREDIDIGLVGECSAKVRDSFGTKYFKGAMNTQSQLEHKYLLSLEGNDVATGLKWQLASRCVVFMPQPTRETFAMEGLLVPFVHYVPVQADGSDLEDMVQWAKDNDGLAQWISEQASQFMRNLWLSDQAQRDHTEIMARLGDIYDRHFGDDLRQCYEMQHGDGEKKTRERKT